MELERNEEMASALRRMGEILSAPAPYGMVHEAEGLIRTVSEVNTNLINERRVEVVAEIEAHIAEINEEVEAAKGDDALRTACMGPLERLRQLVQREESIAHLTQAEQEAVQVSDEAMAKIEEFVSQQVTPPDEGELGVKPLKPRSIVKPADLVHTSYLETSEDVDKFLAELRQKLEAAIASGKRVQIR